MPSTVLFSVCVNYTSTAVTEAITVCFFSLEAKVYFFRITYMMYASSETSLFFVLPGYSQLLR